MVTFEERSSEWAKLPFPTSAPAEPFALNVPAKDVEELKTLLRLSRFAPKTYENSQTDGRYGVSHDWMSNASNVWQNSYDWSDRQAKLNRHPQFKIPVADDDGQVTEFHFMALFSKRQDALPVVMLHGWPGSFLEFHGILDVVRARYQSDKSPFHIVVPSMPGYALTSGPRLNENFGYADGARLIDKFMGALGFGGGYAVQGGDVGCIMAPILAKHYPSVRAIHVNGVFDPLPQPDGDATSETPERDAQKVARSKNFFMQGQGYSTMHATRPATASFAIGSSPIGVLAWVGEKMLEWVDPNHPLPLETILDNISLYWFTDSIARNLWPYRDHFGPIWSLNGLQKPVGYSRFPYDLDQVTRKQVEAACNLQFFKDKDAGGHFAALERPELLWPDVDEFLRKTFPERF